MSVTIAQPVPPRVAEGGTAVDVDDVDRGELRIARAATQARPRELGQLHVFAASPAFECFCAANCPPWP
jgi:hypothetical protein